MRKELGEVDWHDCVHSPNEKWRVSLWTKQSSQCLRIMLVK